MQLKLHLISMPWATPELPSIQVAALKAYADSVFGKKLTSRAYSAFSEILIGRGRRECWDDFDRYSGFEEYPYFVLYVRRFLNDALRRKGVSVARLLKNVNSFDREEHLALGGLDHLERRTQQYINGVIAPELISHGVNVVGFTLNYYQLYSSVYCAQYLRRRYADLKYVFIFGGATASYATVANALRRCGIDGLGVIGEGERKLELILRAILATQPRRYAGLLEALSNLHDGIYDIQKSTLDMSEPSPAFLTEQKAMERLPLPDFDEYFESLRRAVPDEGTYAAYKSDTWLPFEGTRGCFAHCNFCDVHTSWAGFRKRKATEIVAGVLELIGKHRNPRVRFMDNVCDTWAEGYADALIERNLRVHAFMECRVHHPEIFWTKLALAGVESVQIGIEAYSPTLLASMHKLTRAKQNLLVQKWLKELGIESLSNLITHYPQSTLKQIEETKEILRLTPHLDRLAFSQLALLIGSPLDRLLKPEERRELKQRAGVAMPETLKEYFTRGTGEYESPRTWLAQKVYDAWEGLIAWEKDFRRRINESPFLCAIRYGTDEILIQDGRYNGVTEHELTGHAARIYDLCHQGATQPELTSHTGLGVRALDRHLSALLETETLVTLEGWYISLATRPRDEVVRRNSVALFPDRAIAPALAPTLSPAQRLELAEGPVHEAN